MAKPILVLVVPDSTSYEAIAEVRESLNPELLEEYHFLILSKKVEDVSIECFNDCKGLPNGDIEKMISDFTVHITAPAAPGTI